MNPNSFVQGIKGYLSGLSAAERQKAIMQIGLVCDGIVDGGNQTTLLPATAGGGAPTPGAGAGCPIPGRGPSVALPGCPVNCDPCAFPAIETDLRLFSWPEIEAEMWDTDTKLDQVLAGSFPVAAGGSITLGQEVRRRISWIPDCVQISTTWSGGNPQPGFVRYQWATGPKGQVAQTQFGNPQLGNQYECGDGCKDVPFPTYKGCDNIMIGALSSLRLIVSLDPAASSVLETVSVTVYHRKLKKKACCESCANGGSCSCG